MAKAKEYIFYKYMCKLKKIYIYIFFILSCWTQDNVTEQFWWFYPKAACIAATSVLIWSSQNTWLGSPKTCLRSEWPRITHPQSTSLIIEGLQNGEKFIEHKFKAKRDLWTECIPNTFTYALRKYPMARRRDVLHGKKTQMQNNTI